MIFLFATTLVGLIFGVAWLWRLKAVPVWARLSAIVPVAFAAWCVLGVARSLVAAYNVPEDLPAQEQARQLATHISCAMNLGVRFVIAALASTFWLLFLGSRWKVRGDAGDDSTQNPGR
jgi:hypothetical protein